MALVLWSRGPSLQGAVALRKSALLKSRLGTLPVPLQPAVHRKTRRAEGFFQLLPLLETRCIEQNDNAFGIPYPTLEMDAPPTAQRKAKTKGEASPFPVPRHGTLPVVSQWFLNEFVPRSLPRESVCSPAFTL